MLLPPRVLSTVHSLGIVESAVLLISFLSLSFFSLAGTLSHQLSNWINSLKMSGERRVRGKACLRKWGGCPEAFTEPM